MNLLLPELHFDENARLLIYRPTGLLNEAAVDRVVQAIEELESASKEPFDRFSDTLHADEVELNYQFIIRISLHRRLSYGERPPIKSAILATDATIVHYARLHALLTQGSPINVRVLPTREEAANWLGVPVALLVPGTGTSGTA